MVLINFSHPLTELQRRQIEALLARPIEQYIEVPTYFDPMQPFATQVEALTEQVGLSATEWQTLPIVVNLPSLSVIAGVLLAELHGRMGYFPPILRLRLVENSTPPEYEVAEIINLQQVRERARQRR